MPIPKPNKNETRQEFIKRCIIDGTMINEYPDEEQRQAICFRQWDNEKK
jgi:hypothetical protein